MSQLSLFEPEKKAPKKKMNYWTLVCGWIPMVGEIVKIDAPIAYCETLEKNGYCYKLEAKILKIEGDFAFLETTKEWEEKTASNANGYNKAGHIWKVDTMELGPQK